MSVRSDLYNSFANNMNNLGDSAVNLAGTIIDYKGKEKQKAESDERLFNSNKDVLETKYRDGINGLLEALPESIDFDQYSARVQDFNNDFISQARNSGSYDDQTLSWLEGEFMPNQKARNEFALVGITDYAVNAWVANNANSKAQTIAADPTIDVEEAYLFYKQYYENVGLGNIENGPNAYGYLTPDEFKEAIRETKTTQFFKTSCDEHYGYDTTWTTEKALKEALGKSGYNPNPVQMTQLRQQAQSIIAERETNIKNSVHQDNVNYSTDVYSHITQGKYYDTAELDQAIASYPVVYASPLMELKIEAEKSNDVIVYDMISSGSAPLDDDTLACLSVGSDYRSKLISEDVGSRAKALFNSGTQIREVMAWIKNGDFGYTASSAERDKIASDIRAWAKDQKASQEQMDEIDAFFFVENPQLVGDVANVSYVDSQIFPEEGDSSQTEQDQSLQQKDKEAGVEGPSDTETTRTFERTAVQKPVVVPVQKEVDGIVPSAPGTISLGTTKAQGEAIKTTVEQSALPSIDNTDVYNQLFYMKYVECLPNDVVKAKTEQAYKSGYLSKDTAEELAKDFVFGDNQTWQNLIGTVNETVDSMMPDSGYQEKKNVKTRIYQALVKSMGANWSLLDDEAAMNSAMNMIANDVSASEWLGKAQSYSKVSDDPEGYLKALQKARYGDMRNALTDGSLMPYINISAQNEYLAGNPESNGSISDARNFFAEKLGFGKNYDDLSNNLEKLFVEYNVAYSQFRGDVRSLFVDTFKDYVDTGASEMLWVNTEIGGTFAFSDSENKNLYYFPDVSTIKKQDGKLSATWFYAYDTDGDGGPDTEPVKLTSLARIVSDMGGYLKKQDEKNAKNAKTVESLEAVKTSSENLGAEFRDMAAEIGEKNDGHGLIVRGVLEAEANKQTIFQTIASFWETLFSPSKKYEDEDALVRTTLQSIRNQ